MRNIFAIAERLRKLAQTLPREVGEIVVNNTLDNFKNESLDGVKWVPRKDNSSDGERTGRRGLLIKTGQLRRSIRVIRVGNNSVVVGSEVPYAKVQNQGGVTHPAITEKSRNYFWAMYAKTKNPKWKRMALTEQKSFTVNIPARPFLKVTPTLKKKIEVFVADKIRNAIR